MNASPCTASKTAKEKEKKNPRKHLTLTPLPKEDSRSHLRRKKVGARARAEEPRRSRLAAEATGQEWEPRIPEDTATSIVVVGFGISSAILFIQ